MLDPWIMENSAVAQVCGRGHGRHFAARGSSEPDTLFSSIAGSAHRGARSFDEHIRRAGGEHPPPDWIVSARRGRSCSSAEMPLRSVPGPSREVEQPGRGPWVRPGWQNPSTIGTASRRVEQCARVSAGPVLRCWRTTSGGVAPRDSSDVLEATSNQWTARPSWVTVSLSSFGWMGEPRSADR